MIEHLDGLDYDVSNIVFEGDQVRMDDVTLSRSQVLAGMNGSGRALDPEQLVEKGYYYGTRPDATYVQLVFDPNLPPLIRKVMTAAADQWSRAAPGGCINVKETNYGGAQVGVRLFPISTGHAAAAVGAYMGKVGSSLAFDTTYAATASEPSLLHTALHELGHILGFAHPTNYKHLKGTRTTPKTCGNGACKASYPTVMDYTTEEVLLTADDRKSASLLYNRCTPRR